MKAALKKLTATTIAILLAFGTFLAAPAFAAEEKNLVGIDENNTTLAAPERATSVDGTKAYFVGVPMKLSEASENGKNSKVIQLTQPIIPDATDLTNVYAAEVKLIGTRDVQDYTEENVLDTRICKACKDQLNGNVGVETVKVDCGTILNGDKGTFKNSEWVYVPTESARYDRLEVQVSLFLNGEPVGLYIIKANSNLKLVGNAVTGFPFEIKDKVETASYNLNTGYTVLLGTESELTVTIFSGYVDKNTKLRVWGNDFGSEPTKIATDVPFTINDGVATAKLKVLSKDAKLGTYLFQSYIIDGSSNDKVLSFGTNMVEVSNWNLNVYNKPMGTNPISEVKAGETVYFRAQGDFNIVKIKVLNFKEGMSEFPEVIELTLDDNNEAAFLATESGSCLAYAENYSDSGMTQLIDAHVCVFTVS